MKRAGTVAKIVVSAIVFILCGLFILRCCVAADQSVLDSLTVNEALKRAYAADPSLSMITHDTPFEISEDGYMTAYALVIIPDAEQVQITVRYNDSIFSYNSLPEDAPFTYTLTDSESGAVIAAVPAEQAEKWMYNYRRLVFDGVPFTDESNLTVAIWCGEEKITEELIHHADQNVVNEPYTLSQKEKSALAGN